MILAELPEADAAVLTLGSYRCPLGDTLVRFGVELVPPGPWTLAAGGTYTVRAIKPPDTMKLSAHVAVVPSMFPTPLGSAPSGDTLQITILRNSAATTSSESWRTTMTRSPRRRPAAAFSLQATRHGRRSLSPDRERHVGRVTRCTSGVLVNAAE